ncbi:MAG: rRNA pseudouridine synthase [Desulfobacterium sp.]|nr:rRNA pseudouridine synthase [Desulfobacterium sp.]MBU3949851.1 rRNA pseudouridine synthase [Pseudomonadota bacterium]MBU4009457.1 rRNA pseudouridine synthase [Pseudomonadota bacterium]MBU4037824.1 rRNA pseudouridine synthase [Pseudomonadota bacterium]
MRLQKYLSAAGFCSRRKGEKLILSGLVKVNGVVITELGTKVDPAKDLVEVDGNKIEAKDDLIYIALNKPKGYVTTCSRERDKIVLDLVDISQRIYPVGRLDKDSSGLLLLTNDGRLHNVLSHPSFDHEKEYRVTLKWPITDESLNKMEEGFFLLGSKTRPAEISRISPEQFHITLKEGRNRQIRRMVDKVGNKVLELKRIRISDVKLGNLKESTWRYLTEKEKKALLKNII